MAFEAIRTATYFLLDYGVREFERGVSGRRPNNTSKRMRPAPMAMAESATLKAGERWGPSHTSKEAGTAPWTIGSVTVPVAPPTNSGRAAAALAVPLWGGTRSPASAAG